MGDIVPREELSKQGLKGFGGIAGGIGVLVLKSTPSPKSGSNNPVATAAHARRLLDLAADEPIHDIR